MIAQVRYGEDSFQGAVWGDLFLRQANPQAEMRAVPVTSPRLGHATGGCCLTPKNQDEIAHLNLLARRQLDGGTWGQVPLTGRSQEYFTFAQVDQAITRLRCGNHLQMARSYAAALGAFQRNIGLGVAADEDNAFLQRKFLAPPLPANNFDDIILAHLNTFNPP